MKYTRLTKEQLEALHYEFARFLATQQITSQEWETIKKEKPQVAEEEIDIFSDLVWERTLSKVDFLQRIDNQSVICFDFREEIAKMISLRSFFADIDLQTLEGMRFVETHFDSEKIEIHTAQKKNISDRNIEIFRLIEQGFEVSDGEIFKQLFKLIS